MAAARWIFGDEINDFEAVRCQQIAVVVRREARVIQPLAVKVANGLAVYTPNATRSAGITLRVPPGVILRNGRLHLAYTGQAPGSETIAEADLLVP